jgi:fatty acid desaturase
LLLPWHHLWSSVPLLDLKLISRSIQAAKKIKRKQLAVAIYLPTMLFLTTKQLLDLE